MNNRLIVKGQTINNSIFRPSDWVERLAACCASYSDDRRLRYTSGLKPILVNNEKYLSINFSLQDSHPEMWDFIMAFITTNKLITVSCN